MRAYQRQQRSVKVPKRSSLYGTQSLSVIKSVGWDRLALLKSNGMWWVDRWVITNNMDISLITNGMADWQEKCKQNSGFFAFFWLISLPG